MNRLGITTDCVCDLPDGYLKEHHVERIYFYITTDTGRFRDGYEINARNLIEYLENEDGKAETNAPEPEEYEEFFEAGLEKYEEIIHVSISDKISLSYKNALLAVKNMGDKGKRVHVIDSEHLSTGIGHMVVRAVEMCEAGKSVEEILAEAEYLKKHISTSFITRNADYLYRNGRVSKILRDICEIFMLHPVLWLKDGRMSLKTIQFGNYEKSIRRYIKSELRRNKKINRRRVFITHVGCTVKMISEVKEEVEKLCEFDEIIVTKASATISSNCGAGTVGVLYVYE